MPEVYKSMDKDVQVIELEKKSAMEWRKRRHDDWNDNYTLYRDRVINNRITNRQTVNVPLMKYALNTIMKNIDETPALYFSNIDNKHQSEVFYNEYWKEMAKRNKLDIKDTLDKKQGILFGRSFKKINIEDGQVTFEIVDPQDMLVHRYVDPSNLHSSPCIIQTGIYRPLREILDSEEFSEEGKAELRRWYSEEANTLEHEENLHGAIEKAERMQAMGVDDVLDPVLGETYVELNEAYRYEHSKKVKDEDVIVRYVLASTDGGMIKLDKKELHEVIGKTVDNFWFNHFPYSSWGADPERTDFWSDAPADIVRQINKVANVWLSQATENRTLRNFNMHYYDSTDASFVPQTYVPQPWGWYPVGGNPNEKIKTVEIPEISGALEEIQWLMSLGEKATAATAAQTGSPEERQITLGEVQIAVANAEQRIKSIEKYINESWEDFGMLYVKLLEAANSKLDPVTINKKGRQGKKIYTKEVSPKDWLTKSGYTVEIRTKADKAGEDATMVQKLDAVMQAMPDNTPLVDIRNRKLLEFVDLPPEDINAVLEFEKSKQDMMATESVGTEQLPPEQQGQPEMGGQPAPDQGVQQDVFDKLLQLKGRAERVLPNE